MSFKDVLERNRVALGSFLDKNPYLDVEVYRQVFGTDFIGEGIKARLAYEVAERSEQEGFCDHLEPAEFDRNGTPISVALKEGLDIKDWFYAPVQMSGLYLFKPTGFHRITDLRLPKTKAELWKLDAAHRVLYPVYHSQTYLDLCEAEGIKPEDIIVPNAGEFFGAWFTDRVECQELDPSIPLAEQVNAKPSTEIEAQMRFVRSFWPIWTFEGKREEEIILGSIREFALGGNGFLYHGSGPNRGTWLYSRRHRSGKLKKDPYNHALSVGDKNPADGKVKIDQLRTNPDYRRDAKVFSRMQIEGVADDFETRRDDVLGDFEKSSAYAIEVVSPKPDLQRPEEIFDAIRELFGQYEREMVV